ncbi:hypothetical protein [Saccharothrix coeruleofusca]|uniref:DUF4034 domain-containing protein n=1 Tax=Saccharothrix coeruleofusca TaxID=33919 RepID=A0A918AJW7_9PSEU|nr:hypothetical protein [Saccharothrix coeruleofusca]MBP2338711.1 hypothetical protein [Saccharothrix coeruleofusca]GGP46511.1 hypothetical protein GCM10010185_17750 [Saccharothrix coeruleofusca]
MGIFRRRRPATVARAVVRDHTYDDAILDIAAEEMDAGHLRAATTVLAECRDEPEVRALRVEVLGEHAIGHADELLELAKSNGDPDLWLLAGTAFIREAWAVRGSGRADAVGKDRFKVFFATLRKAVAPLHEAAKLLPRDAVPWAQLQTAGMGLQVSREQKDEVWREIVARCPTLYPAHWTRLQILAAKWGGSAEEMMAFAQGSADHAPEGDPVVAMLPLAHFEIFLEEFEEAVRARSALKIATLKLRYFSRVHDEIAAAADKWEAVPQRPHPRALQAHNLFAAAFALADDAPRAKRHLIGMRDHVHDVPWSYVAYLADDLEREYSELANKYL